MTNSISLLTKITQLTSNIETNYPELYRFLDENPLTIPKVSNPTIDQASLLAYFDSLKQLLKHHLATHRTQIKIT
ncbi:hypothetical protein SB49_03020 [Sediminicola sp. YIK13]|uniref:hypothetical protein n=1 Tax=Sediminicola sp. YIK13 TaxID=1453352 RepID=UPI00071F7482|nr:hypothetical protein [Sediminicola sp. YIK13]ALM09138.1 hypothetical protein SB49_03020 [Sediminicola sp. YIK13]